MSLNVITWALERAPVTEPTQILLLIALADRARNDGTCAWPSQKWLANRARCSDRTVRRHLAALEEAGLIRRGDQRVVSHFRADLRPVVWDLILAMEREEGDPTDTDVRADNLSGRTPVTKRPDTGDQNDRTLLSYKPSLLPTGETVREPSLEKPRRARPKQPLPAEWAPSVKHLGEARELGVDADFEAEQMRLWSQANDVRRADWDATFRLWIRRARPAPNRRPRGDSAPGPGTATTKALGWLDVGADTRDPYAPLELDQ